MASRLVLRPCRLLSLSLPSKTGFFSEPVFLKPPASPLFSSFSSALTLAADPDLPYGPSLRKGRKSPTPLVEEENEMEALPDIDYQNFARVFEIAAIRVPAEQCSALESRLRGHLLNWPRIRNVARVPGDEMEPELKELLGENSDESDEEEGVAKTLSRRILGKADGDGERLSPVMYRDKLAKSFNCRGFLKFRNLAKISRPKKKKKQTIADKDGSRCERFEGFGRNNFAAVEVVESEDESHDFRGLLGEGFRGRRWRGSTRLLLLDEGHASKSVEALPQAVKAVLDGDALQGGSLKCELVKCRLTLFYDYWQTNEILEHLLPEGMIIPTAFETVGHIAHLNLREEHLPYRKLIAKVVLDKNKPKIQTVVNKTDSIQNDYRTMQLEVLAGNHSLVTTLTENGLRFHVDLATVYWNSRLATERQRLVNNFSSKDVVCDVFAGVGPIAIYAAKKVKYVYANDLNPSAIEYLERNVVLNKLERKIEVCNMDGRRFIDTIFRNQRSETITQVVMNLPNDAAEFLDAFRGIFRKKPEAILPRIHVYAFSRAQNPELDFQQRIRSVLSGVALDAQMHRVRLVAPGKWMLCGSFFLPEAIAFATEV